MRLGLRDFRGNGGIMQNRNADELYEGEGEKVAAKQSTNLNPDVLTNPTSFKQF